MMSLLPQFKESVKQQHLFFPKSKLLLAVSGGVDSVVLCELCKQGGYDFVIAHCNFKLRGEESERDEQFVRDLGNKYGVEVLVKEFDTEKYAAEKKISIQEAARELRYTWFGELVGSPSAAKGLPTALRESGVRSQIPKPDLLLTGHHADDNAETISMNFFRGTGLHGLTGIPESVGYIRRPLLNFSKDELLNFAKDNQLDFVEDSSNKSLKYTRNFFRNEIIPAISKVYPQARENLQDNIRRFKEIEKLYQLSVGQLKKKLCRSKGKEVHIPVRQLMAFNNRALIYEIISTYGFDEKQVEELVKLAGSESGKYIQSPGSAYRIIKHRHWFIISPVQPSFSANIIIEEEEKSVQFALGLLQIEKTSVQSPGKAVVHGSNRVVSLDAREIRYPLLLRRSKTGDYFYPLGMKKKKKLNRFLIDQKLSKTEKENIWVIESNQRIIWVVNHRPDERCRISTSTKNVLEFRLIPA